MNGAPSAEKKLTAGKVLDEATGILERWEKGRTLQDVLPPGAHPLLQNGLFTLFRRRAELDWLLAQLAARPVRPRLQRILRWTLCELLCLRNVPPAIMADVTVSHVKQRYGAAEAGFVNALLRRFLREGPDCWKDRLIREAPSHVRLGLSPELYAAWESRFPADELVKLAALLQAPAPLIVRRRPPGGGAGVLPDGAERTSAQPSDSWLDADMSGAGPVRPVPTPPWAANARLYTVLDAAAFFASPAFQAGDYYVQDPSTLLAPALLDPRPGEELADLCAAPGGKALLLAEALGNDGTLTCCDRSAGRLAPLRANLRAYANVRLLVADSATPPFPPACFTAVLLDVPCSNSGVIRRRPDVRWRFSRRQLAELVQIQAGILHGAAPLLRPGGRLVYSTCSIEPEEDGRQIAAFLRQHPAFSMTAERLLLPAAEHDGAYAALLVRRAGDSAAALLHKRRD